MSTHGSGDGEVAELADLPVAGVVIDSPLAHLDRVFEYAVPPELADTARPGVRVRVRFAGRDLEGFLVDRRRSAEHDGPLAPLRRVVSPEQVLVPELHALARAVADRYAGTLSDVLRVAIPRRHAHAERRLPLDPPEDDTTVEPPDPGPWSAYPAGPALLRRVAAGEAPEASWLALPSRAEEEDWPRALAVLAASALSAGRGAVLVVPDHRDVDRLDAALVDLLGKGRHVRLTADQGPQARYTAWLKVLRGHVRVAIGTRAAAFAPVRDLGLVAWWDDGDDVLVEQRAPYHHTGVVLGLRARQAGAALVVGGFTRSLRTQVALERGTLVPVDAAPAAVRAAAPAVSVAGEGLDEERDGAASRAHLPSRAWRTAGDALKSGPVLVQVPRRGYLPALRCADCRSPVHCPTCNGPVALAVGAGAPACRWCGTAVGDGGFRCRTCGGSRLRSAVVGVRRTAEEIGRAFPSVPVVTSGSGEEVLARVPAQPALVLATPGAEPVADGGYGAVLLLDAWASLDLPVLDAPVESLRRWAAAAALVRPGGPVVLAGVPEGAVLPPVEALVRWDPAWLAARELGERRELGLPPATRIAQLSGPRRAVAAALEQLGEAGLPAGISVLGPMPLTTRRASSPDVDTHALLRTELAGTADLTRALHALRSVRSARKDALPLGVRVDPVDSW